MKSFARLLALIALGAAGYAGGLVAQVAGLPVRNAGIGTGLGIAGDVGFPNGAAGKGIALGATGVLGLGPLGISASVAHWDPKGPVPAINSVGGTGNLKIFGGPLIPVSVTLQGGLGYSKVTEDGGIEGPIITKTLHLPVGVGLALTIPNPVFSIKPWVAPRLDIHRATVHSDVQTPDTNTDTNFGISGGVDLGFLNGLLIRAMYDRVKASGVAVSVFSLGIGFQVGK